ncbi:hypothetical protein B0E51_03275 [Rhodanobacter sp. C05]|nr:hypothetical protein B0E51_03275 [Rhodanobacter sp. C05]
MACRRAGWPSTAWAPPLKGGGCAVVLLNRSKASHPITVTWEDLHLPSSLGLKMRDLWTHQDLYGANGSFSVEVPSHGVVMVRLD